METLRKFKQKNLFYKKITKQKIIGLQYFLCFKPGGIAANSVFI